MKASIIIILIFILPRFAFSQKKIAFESTPINFVIKNAGLEVNGSIGGLEGFMVMDENGNLIKVEGSIDPNTLKTGITLRDNHLKKTDYFNVKEFPKIFMTSTQLKRISNHKYVGNFELTIKDSRKDVSIQFTFLATREVYTLKGELSINRLDYGLGETSVILSDTVKVNFAIAGK